ncbi:glycosyltransferase [Coriobacteriia bacterium Es71-Z0120]|uniref:glycosyltransferase n=1 Tax=Parvivirga hydrogeniphila TaxID=2939460 RepID=UPI0022609CE3|nr:glycosyltransferase [Parvivirga hydrogeniphila]MCL4079338.1 glycosyltransferase [Parvivirga hydrogeniphila]
MRITMLNKHYPPHLGGIEHHVRDLAEALVERGHAVRAIVANEAPDTVTETHGGVEVVRLGRAFNVSSAPVAFGLARALREEERRADLLHLHSPYPWGELEWLRAAPALPSVLTYHSDIVRQRVLLAGYAPFLRRVLARVGRIIVSSPQMVEHSAFLSPVAEKCRVVPFGIDPGEFADPSLQSEAEAIRARHERPVVLFVGRLIYYKGVDVLVRAMARVDADLVIVGSGPLEAKVRSLASATGVGPRLTILPPLPRKELVAQYLAADVFCLPSVARSEAFGLVQLEAMAAGTPVVSTALPTGVPFVNEHGVSGLVVPPGDADALAEALRTLVADDGLRARLGVQAQERVRAEFTREMMVERTLAVYHEVSEAV